MGEVIAFQGQSITNSRLELMEAVAKISKPLNEVREFLKWKAWELMEIADEPDAQQAIEAWQTVTAAAHALNALEKTSPLWYSWSSGKAPDGLVTAMLEDASERFFPAFLRALRESKADPLA